MTFVKLADVYKKPSFYNPPLVEQLTNNTDFPNLNSVEYRVKNSVDSPKTLPSFWEVLAIDTSGQIVLVANNYVSRKWNGSFWGYEDFDDIGVPEKEVYSTECNQLMTNFQFVEPNIALVSDSNGSVTLWSTKAEIRNGYCAYSIVRKSEHTGRIDCLHLFHKNSTKALTGGTDCCIKVWEMGAGDLCSDFTYRNSHARPITGLSSSHSMPTVFASCSRDKKWAIWDYRQKRPISTISREHQYSYTTLYWSDENENNENLFVGDETGTVYVFDIRNPIQHVTAIEAFNHPIHKLSFEGRYLAILGQTNVVKVFDASNENQLIFENSDATSNVRDIYWNNIDSFYTIAWDSKLRNHQLSNVK